MFRHFPVPRRVAKLGLTSLLCLALGCQSSTEERLKELNVTPEQAKRILAEISSKRAEHEAPLEVVNNDDSDSPSEVLTANPVRALPAEALPFEGWVLDELVDVAPAAPSSATAKGVFVVNGGNELFLAKLGSLSKSAESAASPVATIPDEKGPFALGRGPTLAGGYAYWVTSHFLLRRPTHAPYGPLEEIAQDARVGTRASALTMKNKRGAVAYVALPKVKNGPLRAKLWIESDKRAEPLLLTEPGSSTLSVELVEHAGKTLALSLEARMGMTALHARSFDPAEGKLYTDQVLWIGGTAQPMTEVRALGQPQSLIAFLPIEQDITHFGLAILNLARTSGAQPTVAWTAYENGQDPAPVQGVHACGKDLVLYSRPSTQKPHAPQELVLAELVDGAPQRNAVLSTSRAYYDLSIAAIPGGALLSFVADERTWARTLRCK